MSVTLGSTMVATWKHIKLLSLYALLGIRSLWKLIESAHETSLIETRHVLWDCLGAAWKTRDIKELTPLRPNASVVEETRLRDDQCSVNNITNLVPAQK